MDNSTGLEFDDIERANEQIDMLRQDVTFFRRKWQEAEQRELNERAEKREVYIALSKVGQEADRIREMLSNRIAAHERDIANTDRRVVVLLAMFKELDRRHDFTHAEIRGAIKLIEGYAALIATVRTVDDIPF